MIGENNRVSTQTVGVVGLGYVGIPVALHFAEKYKVIGFDINNEKVNLLNNYEDPTKQYHQESFMHKDISFVTDDKKLRECSYIIVTVPTPLTPTNEPDLTMLKHATTMIGKNLTKDCTVIFESTVFPGTTEEICLPILEKYSKLKSGVDFYVGYSPERINPGDKDRTFRTIPKIVAGQNKDVLEKVHALYTTVIDAELHKAPTIKVAESAKILENTQRDINIAFMNEFSLICDHLNIDTQDVIKAAQTKWNFIPASPGLVGGHCIGVDPYYLIYQSQLNGYHPSFITKAREVNESMAPYVVEKMMHLIVTNQLDISKLTISLLGVTFKENISDTRNSKALEILRGIQQLGLNVQVSDPHVSRKEMKEAYDIEIKTVEEMEPADIVILAVPHKDFQEHDLFSLLKEDHSILMDIKSRISKKELPTGTLLWRL